jgi:hypothetical protein
MTSEPAPALDEAEAAAGWPGEPCLRCGAVGTHYLTCPGLRLPSGYRLGGAPERKALNHR